MRDLRVIVGENVKRYRLETGLKPTPFAKRAGYRSSDLKQLKAGELNTSLVKLQKLAEALGVSVIDLVEDWSEEE